MRFSIGVQILAANPRIAVVAAVEQVVVVVAKTWWP